MGDKREDRISMVSREGWEKLKREMVIKEIKGKKLNKWKKGKEVPLIDK